MKRTPAHLAATAQATPAHADARTEVLGTDADIAAASYGDSLIAARTLRDAVGALGPDRGAFEGSGGLDDPGAVLL